MHHLNAFNALTPLTVQLMSLCEHLSTVTHHLSPITQLRLSLASMGNNAMHQCILVYHLCQWGANHVTQEKKMYGKVPHILLELIKLRKIRFLFRSFVQNTLHLYNISSYLLASFHCRLCYVATNFTMFCSVNRVNRENPNIPSWEDSIVANASFTHVLNLNRSRHVEENLTRRFDVVSISAIIIAGIGIVANSTVIVAFANNRKLKNKIPNIFIVNQVIVYIHRQQYERCYNNSPI